MRLEKLILPIAILITLFFLGVIQFFGFSNLAEPIIQSVQAQAKRSTPLIIDHTAVNLFDQIPAEYANQAKEQLRMVYDGTSHSSQIITGLEILENQNSLYNFVDNYPNASSANNLSLWYRKMRTKYGNEVIDLGNPDWTRWEQVTRAFLNDYQNSSRNVVMWSWCGQVSDASGSNIDTYLNLMSGLERSYPNVTFIYMTGHLDGSGPSGNLYTRNNQIRKYAKDNNKVLFDFADIESYSPDGTYYPNASDSCSWCSSWCNSHSCPSCLSECMHSNCFNCYIKGKAFWVMMARLAGWNPGGQTCTAQGGDICATNETCSGSWLSASDSNLCCSVQCQPPRPSPTPTTPASPTPVSLQGDLDGDGDVDIFDYNILLENFGYQGCGNTADIDADCDVDIFDYNLLVGNFGKNVP